MDRTESTVVQVAPQYENAKIKEMEAFGWNLQGREEIHEKGDAYGAPSLTSNSTYIIKIQVSHYVKLHFVRSLSLPNLQRLRQVETEYFSLPFPAGASLKWPLVLAIFGGLGVIIGLVNLADPNAPSALLIMVSVLFGGLGLIWLRSKVAKRRKAKETCEASARRLNELQRELAVLA